MRSPWWLVVALVAIGVTVGLASASPLRASGEPPDLQNGTLAIIGVASGGSSIWTVQPDGSRLRHLTTPLPEADSLGEWTRAGGIVANPGLKEAFAVRPDGRQIAYHPRVEWSADGRFRVATDRRAVRILRADGSLVRRIALPLRSIEPYWAMWSPARWSLIVGGYDTSEVETDFLVDATSGRWIRLGRLDFFVAWAPDGNDVLVENLRAGHRGSRLVVVSVHSGRRSDVAQLAPYPGDYGHRSAAWSPQGRWIAYTDGSAIKVVSRAGTGRRHLANARRGRSGRRPEPRDVSIAWSPDGALIAFSDQVGIRVLPAKSGSPVPVGPPGGESPVWSPDGTQVAMVVGSRIERVDVKSGKRVVVAASFWDWSVAWAPDGRRLAFVRNYGNVHVLDTVSGADTVIGTGKDPSWSPDGSELAYVRSASVDPTNPPVDFGLQTGRVTVRDMATGDQRVVGLGLHPAWSPDGRTLAYVRYTFHKAYVSGGNYHQDVVASSLRTVDLGSGQAKTVHDEPHVTVGWPEWSPDGHLLGAVSNDNGSLLYLVPVSGGETVIRALHDSATLSRSRGGLLVTYGDSVALLDQTTFKTRTILRSPSGTEFAGAVSSPDGARIAFLRCRQSEQQCDVYTVAASGGQGAVRVTRNGGSKDELVWGPKAQAQSGA